MQKIEFTEAVTIGGKTVTSIEVKPLTFVEMERLWTAVGAGPSSRKQVALQQARIKAQGVYKTGTETVTPTDDDVRKFPFQVAKAIIEELDFDQGRAGEVVGEGDGIITPVIYKLGRPIEMKSGKGETITIKELEFQAETYGDVENVLAAENEIHKALELLKIAKPLGTNLTVLPGWALDRLTVADGVTVMQKVSPLF